MLVRSHQIASNSTIITVRPLLGQVDWGDKTEFIAMTTGRIGYNLDFKATSSSLNVGPYSKEYSFPEIKITPYPFVTVTVTPVLTPSVEGRVYFNGEFRATSGFNAQAIIGGGYSTASGTPTWLTVDKALWSCQAPTVTNTINSGGVSALASLQIDARVELLFGFVNVLTLNMSATLFIKVSVYICFMRVVVVDNNTILTATNCCRPICRHATVATRQR